VTNALLSLFFFTFGIAVLASCYRAMIAVLPNPVYVIPGRAAVRLIILFWGLAAFSFAAWYVAYLRLGP
jgi:hypothetical protein